MRLDGTVAVSVDGRPARLTAAGTALRLEFPDPAAARRVVRGHRGAGSAVAGALTAAGLTLRVYGGRHLLLVLGAGPPRLPGRPPPAAARPVAAATPSDGMALASGSPLRSGQASR